MYARSYRKNARFLSTYLTALKLKPKSSQKLFHTVIKNIGMFGKISIQNIPKHDEDDMYKLLQEWIIWNNDRGLTATSIMCYLNVFRTYCRYCRINLDWNNIMYHLKFPRMLHERPVPITSHMIRDILNVSKYEFRFQLLALISSGMRIGELGQIRLNHLDLSHSNIQIDIPAKITKTGKSRITFFSKQVSDMIRYKIKKNPELDLIFCGNRTPEQSVNLILKRFAVVRAKANLMEKYDYYKQNRYKIHMHSLRAYFITKANRVQFGLGHILAGHNFYMKEYNQYTNNELLDMYREFEKDLIFKNIRESRNLK